MSIRDFKAMVNVPPHLKFKFVKSHASSIVRIRLNEYDFTKEMAADILNTYEKFEES